jgi:hypothetical protein
MKMDGRMVRRIVNNYELTLTLLGAVLGIENNAREDDKRLRLSLNDRSFIFILRACMLFIAFMFELLNCLSGERVVCCCC